MALSLTIAPGAKAETAVPFVVFASRLRAWDINCMQRACFPIERDRRGVVCTVYRDGQAGRRRIHGKQISTDVIRGDLQKKDSTSTCERSAIHELSHCFMLSMPGNRAHFITEKIRCTLM
jgi:hypothetical protein